MQLTFLGTGTSQGVPVIGCECEACLSTDPKDKRLRVSVWIEVEGKHFVIDTGPDFRYQMLRTAVPRIDAILITHEHRDHVAGLDDIRPYNFRYAMDMPVYAVARVQAELRQAFGYIFEATYPGVPMVILKDIEKDKPFVVEGVEVMPIEYFHAALPVMGFRIGNLAYLTDFKTIEADQLEYLKDLDVLIISALQHTEHYSHLSLAEALEMVEKIAPKRAYLTHISHNMGLSADTEKLLPPNVFLAYDGLVVKSDSPIPKGQTPPSQNKT
jgi:phosphoribosyl 1,2-cyclic phosphate phosphodiesterase